MSLKYYFLLCSKKENKSVIGERVGEGLGRVYKCGEKGGRQTSVWKGLKISVLQSEMKVPHLLTSTSVAPDFEQAQFKNLYFLE